MTLKKLMWRVNNISFVVSSSATFFFISRCCVIKFCRRSFFSKLSDCSLYLSLSLSLLRQFNTLFFYVTENWWKRTHYVWGDANEKCAVITLSKIYKFSLKYNAFGIPLWRCLINKIESFISTRAFEEFLFTQNWHLSHLHSMMSSIVKLYTSQHNDNLCRKFINYSLFFPFSSSFHRISIVRCESGNHL